MEARLEQSVRGDVAEAPTMTLEIGHGDVTTTLTVSLSIDM
jgi:hypothetical protein